MKKDFYIPIDHAHGVISLIFDYLTKTYGEKETICIIKDAVKKIYSSLIKDLKEKGLKEMESYLKKNMKFEKGEYSIDWKNRMLILMVDQCPAIKNMQQKKLRISKNFCKFSTELVNNIITKEAGYRSSVEYNQNKGKCIQKFWKE